LRPFKNDFCAQCGSNNPTERDHVPPKNIFLEPRPSTLIVSPICASCHAGTSLDDEYFRDMLIFRGDLKDNEAVKKLTPKVLRGLSRPEKRKTVQAMAENLRKMEVKSQLGLFLGYGNMYTITKERFERVITRTIKGIFYHEDHEPLSKGSAVGTYLLDAIDFKKYKGSEGIINELANCPEVIIEQSTFRYRRFRNIEEGYEVWLLTFYNRVESISFIVHPQVINEA